MPLLLPQNRVLTNGCYTSDSRHSKGDTKAAPGGLKTAKAPMLVSGLFALPVAWSRRHAALPHQHNASAADSAAQAAAATPELATPQGTSLAADSEASRLMTAAAILSSASSCDSLDGAGDHGDDSSSIESSSTVPTGTGSPDLGTLALLDELHTLDVDSLSLAVGILRQHEPLDADEDGIQLSERLRDFLQVLSWRPTVRDTPAGPVASGAAVPEAQPDGFWSSTDEWADVRAALMGVGIDASLDEDDEEDVWVQEAGQLKTRRTRLLRSLPKLDSSTAQQLTAFLADLQQHHSSVAPLHDSLSDSKVDSDTAGDEQLQWWQQAKVAYNLLKQQAGKMQKADGQPEKS